MALLLAGFVGRKIMKLNYLTLSGVIAGSIRNCGGVVGSAATAGPTLNCITWPVEAGSATSAGSIGRMDRGPGTSWPKTHWPELLAVGKYRK